MIEHHYNIMYFQGDEYREELWKAKEGAYMEAIGPDDGNIGRWWPMNMITEDHFILGSEVRSLMVFRLSDTYQYVGHFPTTDDLIGFINGYRRGSIEEIALHDEFHPCSEICNQCCPGVSRLKLL